MNNKLILKEICLKDNTFSYQYEVTGYWKKYFSLDKSLSVLYNVKIVDVPYSTAVIPFLYVFMPLAWMFQATVEIKEVDEEMLIGLENYKEELKKIYPRLRLYETQINAERIVREDKERKNSAVYFSGGVDAWATLLEHLDKKPYLITIIGADVDIDNSEAEEKVLMEMKKVASDFSLKPLIIKTNMRKVVNERNLHRFIFAKENIGYWQGIAAGIGIIGLAAPVSEQLEIGEIYVSTSITDDQISLICRDGIIGPLINSLMWSGTTVKSYGESVNRQEKIEKIVSHAKENRTPIYIRACWRDKMGKNCCKCEKCYRTLMGIVATGENPYDFGFDIHTFDYIKIAGYMKKWFKNNYKGSYRTTPYIFWEEIRERNISKKWYLKWLEHCSFEDEE